MEQSIELNNIRSQLSYLTDTKEIIKQALIDKGANITDETTFRNYAPEIEQLGTVKLYETTQEMNNDLECKDGTISIVYREELQKPTSLADVIPAPILFPAEIQFDDLFDMWWDVIQSSGVYDKTCPFTLINDVDTKYNIEGYFLAGNTGGTAVFQIHFSCNGENIQYTMTSGGKVNPNNIAKRITQTDNPNPVTFTGANSGNYTIKRQGLANGTVTSIWTLEFIRYSKTAFDGLYIFNEDTSTWNTAPTQFTATDADVMAVSYFGANGVSNGNLNAPKYFTDDNYMDISEYCNKYSSLFSSLNTSYITNFHNFGQCIPNSLASVNFITVTNNATNTAKMFAYKDGMYVLTNTTNWDVSNVTDMSYMFYRCANLKYLPVDNWDTTNVTNMAYMFTGCTGLKSISNIHMLNMSNVTNMFGMFEQCTDLECDSYYQYRFTNWNCCNVISMTNMFHGCYSVQEVNMYNWVTTNVQYTINMFKGCTSLNSIGSCPTFPNVLSASNMFYGCNELTRIPNRGNLFNNCTNMYSMFHDCHNLYEVNGLNLSNTENTVQMFYGCNLLRNINLCGDANSIINMHSMFSSYGWGIDGVLINTIPNIMRYTPNVQVTTSAYAHCRKLTEAPINWNMPHLVAMNSMFLNCDSLTQLNMFNCNLPNLKFCPGMITNCTNLTILNMYNGKLPSLNDLVILNIPNLTTINISKANLNNVGLLQFNNLPNLTNLNLGGITSNNLKYLNYFLYGAGKLTNLNVQNLNTVGVLNMAQAFRGCTNLTSLDLTSWDVSNVTNVYYMFEKCNNLITLNISGWNLINVTTLDSMFHNCHNLLTVDVSNWDTSNVTSYYSLFANCSNLTDMNISGWNLDKSTSLQTIFRNCTNLTNLDASNISAVNATLVTPIITNSTKLTNLNMENWNIPNATTITFEYLLNGCPLNELNLVNWDVKNVTNVTNLFMGCTSLKTLNMANWNTNNITTLAQAFYGCTNLTNLDITGWNLDNVTNLYKTFAYSNMNYEPFTQFNLNKLTVMTQVFNNCKYIGDLPKFMWNTSQINSTSNLFTNSCFLNVNIKHWDLSNVTNASYMFSGCVHLQNVDINTQNLINLGNFYCGFYGCINLTNIEFNLSEMTSVNNVSRLFGQCSSLTDINISNWHLPNVHSTGLSYMFMNSGLVNVNMLDCTFKGITTFYNVFYNCNALVNLNMTNMNLPDCVNVSYLCYDDYRLSNVNVSGWNLPNCTYTNYMFGTTRELHNVDMSYWNAPKLSVLNFYSPWGDSLTSVNLAHGQFNNINNLTPTFINMNNLSSLNLYGVNLASLTTLNNAFATRQSLVDLNVDNMYLPNVTTATNMLYYCRKLSDNSKHSIVNMCLNLTNLSIKVFNNTNIQSPIYLSYINAYNIGGVDRSQELIDAGWIL